MGRAGCARNQESPENCGLKVADCSCLLEVVPVWEGWLGRPASQTPLWVIRATAPHEDSKIEVLLDSPLAGTNDFKVTVARL